MAEFDWGGEKIFVSLAMTWRAEGLLVFTASEAAFPAIDAKQSFNEMNVPPTDFGDARMEGLAAGIQYFRQRLQMSACGALSPRQPSWRQSGRRNAAANISGRGSTAR